MEGLRIIQTGLNKAERQKGGMAESKKMIQIKLRLCGSAR
jgi:hypothetical protein